MKKTIHYSKITKIEYEFTLEEVKFALMKKYDISDSRKRVEMDLYEDEDGKNKCVFMTLTFAEDIPAEVKETTE